MLDKNNFKAVKSGIWYTVGNFLTSATVFIISPFFTRFMSIEDVGNFSNYSAWLSMLLVIVTANLYTSVNIAKFDYKEELNEFIASNLLLGSLVTLFFYFCVLLFRPKVINFTGMNELQLNIAFLYFLVAPALQMYQVKCRVEYRYKMAVLFSCLSAVLPAVISIICVINVSSQLTGRVLGYYIPLIILDTLVYIYLVSSARYLSKKYWGYALGISLPLILHTLSGTVLSMADRTMVQNYKGDVEAALYSVAYTSAYPISVLFGSMNMAWSPWAYEKMDEANYTLIKRASRSYIIFFGMIALLVMLVAPEILYIMGGKRYMRAVSVLPPVMCAFVFQFIYSLYVNIEIFAKKQKIIAMGTTFAAGINIILNMFFIPRYGYIAAAYTSLVGYVLLFLFHFVNCAILKKLHYYDTKFNITFLLVFVGIMFLDIWLYKHNVIRYIILITLSVCICFFAFGFRKELYAIFSEKSFDKLVERIKNDKGRN